MPSNYNNIPLVDYFNDIARTIIENEDEIYLETVKYSLETNRNSKYLKLIDRIAKRLSQEIFFKYLTYKDLQFFIVECSKKSQIDDNDHIYSKQGMGWFIGNFVDIAVKSQCFNVDFDKLFIDSFSTHFSIVDSDISPIIFNETKDFYAFCSKYCDDLYYE